MKKLTRIFFLIFAFSCQSGPLTSPREHSDYENHQDPGASAHDYLSDGKFHKLVIEIQAVAGSEPSAETLSNLQLFAQAHLNKVNGVEVVVDPVIPSPGKSKYTLDDVREIENTNRRFFTTGSTIYAYFLFLDGGSSEGQGDTKTLGYAHQNTSIAIFEKSIDSLSGEYFQPKTSTLESVVMEHEFGHLLGLVNVGSKMLNQHQDKDNGAHCTHTNCLMYFGTNNSDVIANLLSNNIPELEADCLADLKGNGGK